MGVSGGDIRLPTRDHWISPNGRTPKQESYIPGFHEWNHDEANTTNGQVDVPF
jgi:hypothetical protein